MVDEVPEQSVDDCLIETQQWIEFRVSTIAKQPCGRKRDPFTLKDPVNDKVAAQPQPVLVNRHREDAGPIGTFDKGVQDLLDSGEELNSFQVTLVNLEPGLIIFPAHKRVDLLQQTPRDATSLKM